MFLKLFRMFFVFKQLWKAIYQTFLTIYIKCYIYLNILYRFVYHITFLYNSSFSLIMLNNNQTCQAKHVNKYITIN